MKHSKNEIVADFQLTISRLGDWKTWNFRPKIDHEFELAIIQSEIIHSHLWIFLMYLAAGTIFREFLIESHTFIVIRIVNFKAHFTVQPRSSKLQIFLRVQISTKFFRHLQYMNSKNYTDKTIFTLFIGKGEYGESIDWDKLNDDTNDVRSISILFDESTSLDHRLSVHRKDFQNKTTT